MAGDWIRLAVLNYVKTIAEYEKRIDERCAYGQTVRAQMEHVGSVMCYRDGSRAGYEDHLPESLDKLAEIADQIDADIMMWAEEASHAHEIFSRYLETRIVWLKWGKQGKNRLRDLTWDDVARRIGYSKANAQRLSERGIMVIYHDMPEEYRRSPVPAQPWQDETK